MKILNIKNLVKEVLENYPETRDNDNVLLFRVWETENNMLDYYLYEGFKNMIINGELSHFESIRRTRQLLQSQYPELRGERYNKRKTIEKEETEEDLEYIKTPFGAPGTTP